MTRDELRERLARTIFDAATGAIDSWEAPFFAHEKDHAQASADAVLSALREEGLAVVPTTSTADMNLAAVEAMIVLVEADNAKCPQESDFQRGMASGAAMTCGSKYLKAAYRAMLAAGDLLGGKDGA